MSTDALVLTLEAGKAAEIDAALWPLLAPALPVRLPVGAEAPVVATRTAVFHEPPGWSVGAQLGVEPSRMRHAGHAWRVHRPLRVGAAYGIERWSISGDVEKAGRAGPVRFVTASRRFYAADGVVAVEEDTVIAIVGGAPATGGNPAGGAVPEEAAAGPALWAGDWSAAAPGACVARLALRGITLTDIVRFAGAIGDFTPIHHDEAHARAFGLDGIIVMGMLPCALLLRVAEAGLGGAGRIGRFAVRFGRPLRPGVPVSIAVHAAGRDQQGRLALRLHAVAGGETIVAGEAAARAAGPA